MLLEQVVVDDAGLVGPVQRGQDVGLVQPQQVGVGFALQDLVQQFQSFLEQNDLPGGIRGLAGHLHLHAGDVLDRGHGIGQGVR